MLSSGRRIKRTPLDAVNFCPRVIIKREDSLIWNVNHQRLVTEQSTSYRCISNNPGGQLTMQVVCQPLPSLPPYVFFTRLTMAHIME